MRALPPPERMDAGMILALAARLRQDVLRDQTYRATPIGRLVGFFLDELAFENKSSKTVDNREGALAWLALDYAHLQPADLTAELCREFLHTHWAQNAANTRAAHSSSVRMFVRWLADRGEIPVDFSGKIPVPKVKDTERRAHDRSVIRQLVVGQDQRRDRIALLLLYWCALRRNELRLVQWRHIDLARRVLTVFGKGGKIREQSIPEPVALELERYVLDENPRPGEFLLFPQKVGRRGAWPLLVEEVIWEKRWQPYTLSGIARWWENCVKRAGLDHFPMHEVRHSAGTHFHETGRDLVATQYFMRHESAATTERVYLHLDRTRHVSEVQRRMVDPLA